MEDFSNLITLYGRKPVLEVLEDSSIDVFRLHLSESNKSAGIIEQITQLARERQIDIKLHGKRELSRISKNGRQDQGVAVDIINPGYRSIDQIGDEARQLIALDRVTNPQNVGMIVRSVAASPMHGLILPKKGSAKIDPLVVKASAGVLLKADIFHCGTIIHGLKALKSRGYEIIAVTGDGNEPLTNLGTIRDKMVFVLGNETEGISQEVLALSDKTIRIPIDPKVESLNVVAATTLIAFNSIF